MPPLPLEARFLTRQIHMEVRINNVVVPDLFWIRCRFSFAEPVASAQFMSPTRRGNYNDEIEIRAGATPGAGLLLRFKGRLRNPSGELWPRAVTHNVVGELQLAAEYFNAESIPGNSGMWIPQILGRAQSAAGKAIPWAETDWYATSDTIIAAVLTIAGVPFVRADIHGSPVLYGGSLPQEFIWQAGVPTTGTLTFTAAGMTPIGPTQSGETALGYAQRYDQIDAEWGGPANPNVGGFYRLTEGLGGRVYRVRIGGRPYTPWNYAFVESGPGCNILEGSRIERQYPTGNRMIVTGADHGGKGGPMRFSAQRNNPFMLQETVHYAPNAPSSSMIEWATRAMSAQMLTALGSGGQNCEDVAEAALLEANKEAPIGQIITAEDTGFTQGISVLVAGTYDPVSTASTPGRLMSNEPFFVQGLTFDCGMGTEGEPILTQTLEVAGGGLDPQPTVPPDWVP